MSSIGGETASTWKTWPCLTVRCWSKGYAFLRRTAGRQPWSPNPPTGVRTLVRTKPRLLYPLCCATNPRLAQTCVDSFSEKPRRTRRLTTSRVSWPPDRHPYTLDSAALSLRTRNASFRSSSTLYVPLASGPSSPRDGPTWGVPRAKTYTGSETVLTSGSLPTLLLLSITAARARRPAA